MQVVYKTLNPQWNQTLDFTDDGSPLVLHVKDYNYMLPVVSIGHCVVDYEKLPPNQTIDRWIPLVGVAKGEIHMQLTRRQPESAAERDKHAENEGSNTLGSILSGVSSPQRVPVGTTKLQRTSGKVITSGFTSGVFSYRWFQQSSVAIVGKHHYLL